MQKHTFIVSDETVNSYGFVVLTAGIDTAYFEKHPVMYYMHDRNKGVVGRWENLRKKGGKLLADAVFDDSTELAKQVQNQVEKGFLRSASISIDNATTDVINGVSTVIKCRLYEISIVDIPSNENAVKLYRKDGSFTYDLARLNNVQPFDLRAALIALLGVSEYVSDEEIFTTVQTALQHSEAFASVDNAITKGYIDADQKDVFMSMAKATPAAFNALYRQKEQKERKEINTLITNAINCGKILRYESAIYEEIGNKVGLKAMGALVDTLKTPVSICEVIDKSKDPHNRQNWTLDDYRKYAPEELKNNPELYKALLAKEKGITPERSLDWYRKNDPEALRTNPELFKTLTNKK